MAFSSWLNALTTVCPVNISSIWPLISPVLSHCSRKYLRERLVIRRTSSSEGGKIAMVMNVISQLMRIIMINTPMTITTEEIIWMTFSRRVLLMLSMSLTTRLSKSPRE